MQSQTVILKEAEFAGIKIVFNGTSVAQFATIEQAITSAKQLDLEATSFEFQKKDGSKEIIEF